MKIYRRAEDEFCKLFDAKGEKLCFRDMEINPRIVVSNVKKYSIRVRDEGVLIKLRGVPIVRAPPRGRQDRQSRPAMVCSGGDPPGGCLPGPHAVAEGGAVSEVEGGRLPGVPSGGLLHSAGRPPVASQNSEQVSQSMKQ